MPSLGVTTAPVRETMTNPEFVVNDHEFVVNGYKFVVNGYKFVPTELLLLLLSTSSRTRQRTASLPEGGIQSISITVNQRAVVVDRDIALISYSTES